MIVFRLRGSNYLAFDGLLIPRFPFLLLPNFVVLFCLLPIFVVLLLLLFLSVLVAGSVNQGHVHVVWSPFVVRGRIFGLSRISRKGLQGTEVILSFQIHLNSICRAKSAGRKLLMTCCWRWRRPSQLQLVEGVRVNGRFYMAVQFMCCE